MSIPSIDELRARALSDYAGGRRGSVLIDWAFILAAAKGRLALAEREMRVLEEQERDVRYRAAVLFSEDASEMVMAKAPGPIFMGRAKETLALAVEYVAAAETMLLLLAKAPKPEAATPKAAPLPRSVPAVAPGARFAQAGGKR